MRTKPLIQQLNPADAHRADEILRRCVHCGFCNSVCPTYALTGRELDGPRGRIYLTKGILEGQKTTSLSREYLDRCLTCKACETACPSGVEYHVLADIGRKAASEQVPYRGWRYLLRQAVRYVFSSPSRLRILLLPVWLLRPLLPRSLRRRLPDRGQRRCARKVTSKAAGTGESGWVLLSGCVQEPLAPGINAAVHQVFLSAQLPLSTCSRIQCCGALPFHLGSHAAATRQVISNIRIWDQMLEQGALGVLSAASGCTAFIQQYPEICRSQSSDLQAAAARVAQAVSDPVEVLSSNPEWMRQISPINAPDIALHAPCSQQHALGLDQRTENFLREIGMSVSLVRSGPACCGSAGPYSLLHPRVARDLRDAKLSALTASGHRVIATANVGCRLHLQGGTTLPVRHWLEYLSDALEADRVSP